MQNYYTFLLCAKNMPIFLVIWYYLGFIGMKSLDFESLSGLLKTINTMDTKPSGQ